MSTGTAASACLTASLSAAMYASQGAAYCAAVLKSRVPLCTRTDAGAAGVPTRPASSPERSRPPQHRPPRAPMQRKVAEGGILAGGSDLEGKEHVSPAFSSPHPAHCDVPELSPAAARSLTVSFGCSSPRAMQASAPDNKSGFELSAPAASTDSQHEVWPLAVGMIPAVRRVLCSL